MVALAKNDTPETADEQRAPAIERMKNRLDLLDQRLDNIDSVVSAVGERGKKKPTTFKEARSQSGQKIKNSPFRTQQGKG